jgi:poly(3-hydroxybutyrate) depolymerase
MMKLLGLGMGLLLAGCSSDTIVVNSGGDGGTGNDSSSPTDDGSPTDDSATLDSGPADSPGPPDRSKCTKDPDKTGLTTRTYTGAPDYTVYVPKTYDPNVPSALVEILHGAGDTTPNYINVWTGVADMRNVILLAPEASTPLGPGFTWSTGDETFILAELEDLAHCYSIDSKRRILHGYSAGGIMAYLFGLSDAAKYSGIAIFSADEGTAEYYNGGSLLPSSWLIPVSHFHGMSDTNFPIASAKAGIDKLAAAGHPTFWHPIPGDHSATPTAANALTEFDDLKGFSAP